MSHSHLTIDQIKTLIHKGEVADPIVFLESVMGGRDPRKLSAIYELILEVDSFTGGEVSNVDWNEIVDYANQNAKYAEVTISASINASKTLAEYLHPKRKQIDIVGPGGISDGDLSKVPLTEEDISLFKEIWNDEF